MIHKDRTAVSSFPLLWAPTARALGRPWQESALGDLFPSQTVGLLVPLGALSPTEALPQVYPASLGDSLLSKGITVGYASSLSSFRFEAVSEP